MPSTYIQRTPSGGNRKKWTWSAWIKFANPSSTNRYLWSGYSASNNTGYLQAYFHNDEQLTIGAWDVNYLNTTRLFRDVNAWYHIVIVMDTAQATAANRLKLYINGVEETVFDTDSRSSIGQNSDMGYNSNGLHTIGGYGTNAASYPGWDGIMSHIHFTDGYAYTPSAFGETDATTGEWKINSTPSVSYGTTGYWILKNDAGVSDQSPNSNNWSVIAGNLTKTEDNPSNIFATLNPLHSGSITFSNGNNTQGNTSSTGQNALSTLGAVSGKFYAEVKCTAVGSNGTNVGFVNLSKSNLMNQSITPGQDNFSAGLYSNGGPIYYSSETTFATVGSTSNGDIIQLAMDLDNGYLYWGRNGTYLNSGDPTSGSTGTGGLATSNLGDGHIGFGMWQRNSATASWNFGNGYFGTTAVSSAGTNASGNGIFEYDVPTGFTALSTKGLNE